MRDIAATLAAKSGWRRNSLCFLFGVLAVAALPPFFIFPLLVVSFTGLYLVLTGARTRRRAFWDGWFWGWGYHMAGLYWFCIALLTDAEKFAWLIPFTLFGLMGVIAIYCGIITYLFHRCRIGGMGGIFVFAVFWTAMEYARGHLFSGFPWNLPGYSFAASNISIQSASLFGAYGLSFIAVWLAALPAGYFLYRRAATLQIILGYGALLALLAWGSHRLAGADSVAEADRFVPGVSLRLVQGNIAQSGKWDPKLQMHGLQEYIRLTVGPGLEKATHIIWPETAIPYEVKEGSPLTYMLGTMIPPEKILISGALREEGEGSEWQVWNSMVALAHGGTIVGSYDKHKLVPFGEFLPMRDYLPEAVTTPAGMKDFSRGPGPRTVSWPGLPPASPLLCYEVIFPELVIDHAHRPEFLLNLTNDAWFGNSTGPYQHFHMARFRAAEQGLPLIRSANTGISASIDPYGRVLQMLPLNIPGVLDVQLPKPILEPTVYFHYGDSLLLILLAGALFILLNNKRKRQNH